LAAILLSLAIPGKERIGVGALLLSSKIWSLLLAHVGALGAYPVGLVVFRGFKTTRQGWQLEQMVARGALRRSSQQKWL